MHDGHVEVEVCLFKSAFVIGITGLPIHHLARHGVALDVLVRPSRHLAHLGHQHIVFSLMFDFVEDFVRGEPSLAIATPGCLG